MEINFSGVGYKYEESDIEIVASAMRAEDTLTQGNFLRVFEEKFTQQMGSGYSFAISNAASGLELLANALNFRPGEEVVIPSHTYTATAYPFLSNGATIVWSDIHPEEYVVTAETIAPCITDRTKAVVVVDLYGLPVDIDSIADLCRDRGVFLISDSAQSLGAKYDDGSPVGSKCDAAVFSFQSHKNISTLGEGGMLWLPNESALASKVRGLRHNGHAPYAPDRKYYWYPAMVNVDADPDLIFPRNYCLGEVQCALGAHLLDRIEHVNDVRRRRYNVLRDRLMDSSLAVQTWNDSRISSHHLIPLRYKSAITHEDTNVLMTKFLAAGIKPAKQYHPLHQYDFYRKHGVNSPSLPETEKFYMQQISLPFQSWMSDLQFTYLVEVAEKLAKESQ